MRLAAAVLLALLLGVGLGLAIDRLVLGIVLEDARLDVVRLLPPGAEATTEVR